MRERHSQPATENLWALGQLGFAAPDSCPEVPSPPDAGPKLIDWCGIPIGHRVEGAKPPGTTRSRSYDTDVTAEAIRYVVGLVGTDLPNAWEWIAAVLIASFVSVMYWIGRGRRP